MIATTDLELDLKHNMRNKIKLLLALLLFICLADMPYGYFQFVRFISCIVFAYLAYEENLIKSKLVLVYVALAVLFQPFFKISLGRELWNIVDVIVAVFLIRTILKKKEK